MVPRPLNIFQSKLALESSETDQRVSDRNSIINITRNGVKLCDGSRCEAVLSGKGVNCEAAEIGKEGSFESSYLLSRQRALFILFS
jgi:hypothetical protein